MPLKVKDGETWLEAWALSDEAWVQLERENRAARHLRFPCCGSAAVLRTSHLGTRYFAHLPSQVTCTEREASGESFAHLHAKALVAQAGTQLGWHARTEAAGDGWRADVLLERDGVRVAVEIQLSPQSWAVTLERSERYRAAGIACLWLVSRSFRESSRLAPIAMLDTNRELVVTAPGLPGGVPVAEFLAGALDGRFAFRSDRPQMLVTQTQVEPEIPQVIAADLRFYGGQAFCRRCNEFSEVLSRASLNCPPELKLPTLFVSSFEAIFMLPAARREEVLSGSKLRRPRQKFPLGPQRLIPPENGPFYSRPGHLVSLCHQCSWPLTAKTGRRRPWIDRELPWMDARVVIERDWLSFRPAPPPPELPPEKWSWRWDKTPAEPLWHPFRVDTVSTESRVTALATEKEP